MNSETAQQFFKQHPSMFIISCRTQNDLRRSLNYESTAVQNLHLAEAYE